MEPNSLENKFKEKLNSREIQPSDKAWDRLDAMLTLNEKPKRNYRWMYFAASILGFILIATVFFSQTEEVTDAENVKVVLEQQSKEVKDSNLEELMNTSAENNSKKALVTTEKKQKMQMSTNIAAATTKKFVVTQPQNKAPEVKIQKTNDLPSRINEVSNPTSTIKVSSETLLASVEAQNTKSLATKNSAAIKVSSYDLLTQVDSELEQSFREKVIQSVNKKYHEVKVAFANRNLK